MYSRKGGCQFNQSEGREENFLWQAREIRKYGAAAVVMAFDENGQATSLGHKLEV
ncbi:MAG: hypothetical protein Ct9H300mP28_37760 [Pseudomonadota bacterium]|nr:MAG: hypothetical protein Ct9H300mP28_37760 [Pseudomonadota bacterium]